jgi:hypothetical protein
MARKKSALATRRLFADGGLLADLLPLAAG